MEWKDDIDSKPLSLRTKSDIYKFLKSILNFGVKWHGFNFIDVYNKMTKFTDPIACRKEMSYYTYEDFKKFITHAQDLKTKVTFEILYYCGLRKGELKALTWKDIYFDKRILSVNKQLTQSLINDLKELYDYDKKTYANFNDDFFVYSNCRPIETPYTYIVPEWLIRRD